MLWISHFGHPIAAAVDAAPMRRECDEVLARPLVVEVRTEFMSVLVQVSGPLNACEILKNSVEP